MLLRIDRTASRRLRNQAVQEEGAACYVCGFDFAAVLNLHHFNPLGNGGNDTADNWVMLCPNCHAVAHKLLKASYTPMHLATVGRIIKNAVEFDALQKWIETNMGSKAFDAFEKIVRLSRERGIGL